MSDKRKCAECGQDLLECLKHCDLLEFFHLDDGESLEGFTVVDSGEIECIVERDSRFFQIERDWEYVPYEGLARQYFDYQAFEVKKVRRVQVTYQWVKV